MTTGPRTPWWRRPGRIFAAVLLAVVVVWCGRCAYRLATAEPAPIVDHAARLEALSASVQGTGENGWDLLIEAITIAGQVNADIEERYPSPDRDTTFGPTVRRPDYNALLGADLVEADLEPELAALDALRDGGVFARLTDVSRRALVVRPLQGVAPPLLMNLMLPELNQLRRLAKARTGSMRLAARDRDEAERLRAFEDTLALARALRSQPVIIDHLVGLAIGAMVLGELRMEIAESPIDAEAARALLAAIDRQLGPAPGIELALEGERLFQYGTIQWAFTDDGHGDGRLVPSRLGQLGALGGGVGPAPGGLLERLAASVIAGRRETLGLIDEAFDGAVRNAGMRPDQRATQGFDLAAFEAKLGFRHHYIALTIPALDTIVRQGDVADLDVAITRLMLAIAGYRATHDGAPPPDLDALVPDWLDAVPIDPMCGQPFVYRPAPTPGADPRLPYTLYARGIDGVDDVSIKGFDRAAGEVAGEALEPGLDYAPRTQRDVGGP